ncbi:putative reverse transcriptase domain-containing protein [Tanacetum coccineum]
MSCYGYDSMKSNGYYISCIEENGTKQTPDQQRPEKPNTTSVTNAQLQAMIDQGITAALAAHDANRNAQKELPVFLNGLKEWSLFSISVTVQLKIKSSLLLALSIQNWKLEIWDLSKWVLTDKFIHQCCSDLALLCGRMFPEEDDKIEKYVDGLPDMIHGSVVASKPKTMHDAVEITTELMDKKIRTFAECQTESKRKFEDTSRNTQNQQQQQNKEKGTGSGQKPTCYECGVQGHFKRECSKLKNNNNRGNQVGGGNAPAKVYAIGHAGTNPNSNVMTGTFLLNNHYALS